MQVYKIRNFYFQLFIGLTVVLIGLFLFAFFNLDRIPMVLIIFPFVMIGKVFSLCNREILFLKEDHLVWDSGMGPSFEINYDAIVNVNISKNLKTAKLEVKVGDEVKKVTLFLSYLNKDVRPAVAEFLKSKAMRLAAA